MSSSSCWTGQRGLQPLPSKSLSSKRRIENYSLPDDLILDNTTNNNSVSNNNNHNSVVVRGLPVLTLAKNGKQLQPRRLAFTKDRRCIVLITQKRPHRFATGIKSFFRRNKNQNNHYNNNDTASVASLSTHNTTSNATSATTTTNPSASMTTTTTAAMVDSTQIKVIPLLAVDRIQRGPISRRFLHAEDDGSALAVSDTRTGSVLELDTSNATGTGTSSSPHNNKNSKSSTQGSVASSTASLSTTSTTMAPKGMALSIVYRSYDDGSQYNHHQNHHHSFLKPSNSFSTTISNSSASTPVSSSSSSSSPTNGGGYGGQLETLDLVLIRMHDYEALLSALEDLVALCQEEKQRSVKEIQFIHASRLPLHNYRWESSMTLQEWLGLTERIQSPLKKSILTSLYKEACEDEVRRLTTTETTTTKNKNHKSSNSSGIALFRRNGNHNNHHQATSPSSSDNNGNENALPFYAVSCLMEEIMEHAVPYEQDPVEQIWSELVASDPVPAVVGGRLNNRNTEDDDGSLELSIRSNQEESISAVALLTFLRNTQKEYSTTQTQVMHLVELLNQQSTTDDWLDDKKQHQQRAKANYDKDLSHFQENDALDDAQQDVIGSTSDRLSKSRFRAFLTCDANDLLDPVAAKVGAHDMTHPLSHYWIASSHDTYRTNAPRLPSKSNHHRHASHNTADGYNYTAALLRGVRCLELDLWDPPSSSNSSSSSTGHSSLWSEPVVGATPQDAIPVRVVLRAVRHFLEQEPYSFPVILCLENHCSFAVQAKLGPLLYELLGAAKLLYLPPQGQSLHDETSIAATSTGISSSQPSPEAARGKVIIMGKRPKVVRDGCTVVHDDYDVDNDIWDGTDWNNHNAPTSPTTRLTLDLNNALDGDDDDSVAAAQQGGVVIGFDEKGPIRSPDATLPQRSPSELLEKTIEAAQRAEQEAADAREELRQLEQQLRQQENVTAQWNQKASLVVATTSTAVPSPDSRLSRNSRDKHGPGTSRPHYAVDHVGNADYDGEQKSSKDEGIEVHEVLTDYVKGGRDRYAQATQLALEASQRVSLCRASLREAEEAMRKAEEDVAVARERKQRMAETARRAAAEARAHREHAETARERVQKVRTLLQESLDSVSSAGTVVQTATTESKISEKRACEAEARAARAMTVAERDRARAEAETKKEEDLEQEVGDLHADCTRANEHTKACRQRLEKATAILERVGEQIKLIENSSQYRKEIAGQSAAPRQGGSFLAKHAAKVQESETCKKLITEANEALRAAERRRKALQQQLEDKANMWRVQADLASQFRRTADRSTHLAEEMAEHAEEEREAAALRHVAREKAEAAVCSRGSQKESYEAQLAEAEKAALEANALAEQSRRKADLLAREVEKMADNDELAENLQQRQYDFEEMKAAYNEALEDKEQKERLLVDEKRRLDTASEVYKTAVRDAAMESDRARAEGLNHKEALVALNKLEMMRREVDLASTKAEVAEARANAKRIAVGHARLYKDIAVFSSEIPISLARLTLLHRSRLRDWEQSLTLSNAHVHCISQNVLSDMWKTNRSRTKAYTQRFTNDHLMRIFPSWKFPNSSNNKTSFNWDPVRAWSLGCQLVAMNLQLPDENLMVADGRFRQNGSCGYVLKPPELLKGKPSEPQQWFFSILSAFNLPKIGRRNVNPFVRVSIFTGEEESQLLLTTPPAGPNGLNPVWEQDQSCNVVITNPSIAMVAFVVWDKVDDRTEDFVAGAAMPVSCLRQGYRSVALFDVHHSRSGAYEFASLLVKASKR